MPSADVQSATSTLAGTTSAMGSTITVRISDPGPGAAAALDAALDVMHVVDRACTRFDPASPLMRANRAPEAWHHVPQPCLDALVEAHDAYERTGGAFDPRVLDDLLRLGYHRSRRLEALGSAVREAPRARDPLPPWRPQFRPATGEVRLGPRPVDLGGIGKGLAVRWAAQRLQGTGAGHLVDAGGDCWFAGLAPEGGPWLVGVEDPAGGDGPVAVLAVTDAAVATSSVRINQWQAAGVPVHHLVDPRTGQPGGEGLLAVTVVGPDPADAEVWSKVLFLAGRDGVAAAAERLALPALWADVDGALGWSSPTRPLLEWVRPS